MILIKNYKIQKQKDKTKFIIYLMKKNNKF